MCSPMYKTIINENKNHYETSCSLIGNYRDTVVSRDWAGFKWCPVLKVWMQLEDKRNEEMQNFYRWKPSYSYVKYSARMPLLLLTFEKTERENFDFVFFLSFPSSITKSVYTSLFGTHLRQTSKLTYLYDCMHELLAKRWLYCQRCIVL